MTWPLALRSLERPGVRRFFAGQTISLLGSWMQPVAVSWLAWRLSHSSALLGLVTFLTYAPALFLAGWAGVVADRVPRKPLVMGAVTVAMVHAFALAALTASGLMQPWLLAALAMLLGVAFSFEVPARQALFADLAGEDTPNLVALNSTVVTAMRVVGPWVGGQVIALFGEEWCFLANAVSFLAVLLSLWTLEVPKVVAARHESSLTAGLRFIAQTPKVRSAVLLLLGVSLFGLPWATLMPVVAEEVLRGDAALLGRLLAGAGVGSLVGALVLLAGSERLQVRVGLGALVMGLGLTALSFCQSAGHAAGALVLVGFGQLTLSSGVLSLLQTWATPELRGRVMGVFTAIFVGVPPFGSLVVGALAHGFGAPLTLRGQGVVVAVGAAAYLGWRWWRASSPRGAPPDDAAAPPSAPLP